MSSHQRPGVHDLRRKARVNQETRRSINVRRKNKTLSIILRMSAMMVIVVGGLTTYYFSTYAHNKQYKSLKEHESMEVAITMSGLNESNPDAEASVKSDIPETKEAVADPPHKNIGGPTLAKAPIVWLMSFPHSGASSIMQVVRKASNCLTATNYPSQNSGWKGKPSVPVLKGADGENGPFFEDLPGQDMANQCSSSILTSTHCTGYCSDFNCSLASTILTPPAFHVGCLSAVSRVLVEDEVKSLPVVYNPSIVGKAVHLFRHPIDAVIARFNDLFDSSVKGDTINFAMGYAQTRDGFRQWCADNNAKNQPVLDSVDAALREELEQIPCFHEFLQFVRWHNLAFAMTHELDLLTLLLDYHEFGKDFAAARDKVLSFLGAPLVDESKEFVTEKTLRDYFTDREKKDIRAILKVVALPETWEQLESYNFESSSFAEDTMKHLYLLETGHLFF